MTEDTQVPARYETTRKVKAFARKHPMLTLFGLGGAALFGGVELAAGVVIGAGLDALLRRQKPHEETGEASSQEAPSQEAPIREKSRRMMSRGSHVIRERARAVVDAARGKQPVVGQPPVEVPRSEQPATD